MKPIKFTTYKIATWLIPTAIMMISSVFLTFSNAEASNINLSYAYNSSIKSNAINADDLTALTNEKRVKAGLKPLSTNLDLVKAAKAKSLDMKEKNYFEHFRPTDGKTPWAYMDEQNYRWTLAGENLARGYKNNSQVVEAWMKSSTHKKNILNPKYQEIGVTTIEITKDGQPITLTVQMFGSTSR